MYELEFLRRVSFVVLTGHFITEELVFVRCITSVSEVVFEKGGKCEFFFRIRTGELQVIFTLLQNKCLRAVWVVLI